MGQAEIADLSGQVVGRLVERSERVVRIARIRPEAMDLIPRVVEQLRLERVERRILR